MTITERREAARTLGREIRHLLIDADMSVRDLADASGLKYDTVRALLCGKRANLQRHDQFITIIKQRLADRPSNRNHSQPAA